jgi:arabinogalactan oligomer/maltooligosaccharide transport system permease protein
MFAQFLAIVAVPTVVLFQFLQRYIVSGLTAGAVKG